jgi:AcrR family transcriptional regulator
MPKVVDPVERRRDLAEAVWRVIRRDGLEYASVRNVAREAGLSMGSLRHYFGTQSELLIFAMRMVIERIDGRLAKLDPDAEPRQAAERFLCELLPLDAERQEENEVWLAYTARAQVDPALRALRDEAYDLLRRACLRCAVALAGPGPDSELEADRLFALLDGLAVHVAMRPEHASPDRVRAVLARHLDELAARPAR